MQDQYNNTLVTHTPIKTISENNIINTTKKISLDEIETCENANTQTYTQTHTDIHTNTNRLAQTHNNKITNVHRPEINVQELNPVTANKKTDIFSENSTDISTQNSDLIYSAINIPIGIHPSIIYSQECFDHQNLPIPGPIHPNAVLKDPRKLAVLLGEIPYCLFRTYNILHALIETNDQASLYSWGSCIVYLTSFCARLAHENPAWFSLSAKPFQAFTQTFTGYLDDMKNLSTNIRSVNTLGTIVLDKMKSKQKVKEKEKEKEREKERKDKKELTKNEAKAGAKIKRLNSSTSSNSNVDVDTDAEADIDADIGAGGITADNKPVILTLESHALLSSIMNEKLSISSPLPMTIAEQLFTKAMAYYKNLLTSTSHPLSSSSSSVVFEDIFEETFQNTVTLRPFVRAGSTFSQDGSIQKRKDSEDVLLLVKKHIHSQFTNMYSKMQAPCISSTSSTSSTSSIPSSTSTFTSTSTSASNNHGKRDITYNSSPSNLTIGEEIITVVQNIGRLWRRNVTPRAEVDFCEGSFGIHVTPGVNLDTKMVSCVSNTPYLLEWTERETRRKKQNWWSDLTLAVTLQWCIDRNPSNLLSQCIDEVKRMPISVQYHAVKKVSKRTSKRNPRALQSMSKILPKVVTTTTTSTIINNNNNISINNKDPNDNLNHNDITNYILTQQRQQQYLWDPIFESGSGEPTHSSYYPLPSTTVAKYTTITPTTERRIYCLTHVILVISEFGSRPILPSVCSKSDLTFLATVLGGWLVEFQQSFPLSHVLNREIVLEIAICILICKQNGVNFSSKVISSLKDTVDLCIEDHVCRSGTDTLRYSPAGSKESVYVPYISINQSRDKKGAMFADYHTHYLVALLFQLVIVDTFQGCGSLSLKRDIEESKMAESKMAESKMAESKMTESKMTETQERKKLKDMQNMKDMKDMKKISTPVNTLSKLRNTAMSQSFQMLFSGQDNVSLSENFDPLTVHTTIMENDENCDESEDVVFIGDGDDDNDGDSNNESVGDNTADSNDDSDENTNNDEIIISENNIQQHNTIQYDRFVNIITPKISNDNSNDNIINNNNIINNTTNNNNNNSGHSDHITKLYHSSNSNNFINDSFQIQQRINYYQDDNHDNKGINSNNPQTMFLLAYYQNLLQEKIDDYGLYLAQEMPYMMKPHSNSWRIQFEEYHHKIRHQQWWNITNLSSTSLLSSSPSSTTSSSSSSSSFASISNLSDLKQPTLIEVVDKVILSRTSTPVKSMNRSKSCSFNNISINSANTTNYVINEMNNNANNSNNMHKIQDEKATTTLSNFLATPSKARQQIIYNNAKIQLDTVFQDMDQQKSKDDSTSQTTTINNYIDSKIAIQTEAESKTLHNLPALNIPTIPVQLSLAKEHFPEADSTTNKSLLQQKRRKNHSLRNSPAKQPKHTRVTRSSSKLLLEHGNESSNMTAFSHSIY